MRPASTTSWDDKTQQFAHPSGIIVATPDGRLSRYFFGIEYASRDVKFALIESSAGRIGNAIDQLLLYCYHYDPATGSYGFVAMGAVRIGGAVTLVALRRVRASSRFGARAPRNRRTPLEALAMSVFGIPIFPEQASTFAMDVDALYFFIIAVSAFFALLVAVAGDRLRRQVPPPARRRGRARASKATCRWSCCGASSRPSSRW